MSMFHKRVHTEIDIEASPRDVWEVLTDFRHYPSWNPMVRRAEGILRPGERLRLEYRPRGRRSWTFRPWLLTVEAGRELSWKGHPRVQLLVESIHSYRLSPLVGGGTRLDHDIVFWGALTPLLDRTFEAGTRDPFAEQNAALKQRAEGLFARGLPNPNRARLTSAMTKPAAGYPRHYAVNDRPVKLVKLATGGVDALVFDFATGGWQSDPAYFLKISDGGDVDSLTADAFEKLVAHVRSLSAEKRQAAPIEWHHTGDGEFPYEATVDGRALQIRVNDFPAEPLYTLIVDGEAIEDLEDWPAACKKPATR